MGRAFVFFALGAAFSAACGDSELAPPCEALTFETCAGGSLELAVITAETRVPQGIDALAAIGDILLANDRVVAVIDSLDHPGYLAPTGGAILDLVVRDSTSSTSLDALNHLFQGTGLLPGDAAFYDRVEVLEGSNFKAVIFRGALAGHPKQTIATRYEVRPCEPGIRVRTELVNGEPDATIWTITDAWYWGGRSILPFTPHPGAGFVHPEFELTDINEVYRDVPFLVASGHSAASGTSYAEVACNAEILSGFHADSISAMGTRRKIVEARDSMVFERFIGAALGNRGVEPAVRVATDIRRRLFQENYVEIRGRLSSARPFEGENRAQIILSDETGTPWSETLPAADGSFSATVPANKTITAQVRSFGRVVSSATVEVGSSDAVLPDLRFEEPGIVDLSVRVDGSDSAESLVFFHPADEETRQKTTGTLLDNFVACAPMLGPPHGGSPACNRVLVNGRALFEVPGGRYDVYATAGPFASIALATIEVSAAKTSSVTLELARLPVAPAKTLSADFHVHGGASFDSSIPDLDRVRAFLASGIEVLATTDHDAVHDYAEAMAALGAGDKIKLMTGVETTGHILFNLVEDNYIPKVIGHWNFWPLPYRPTAHRRGAPIDDLIEPAVLFDRARALGLPPDGVIQLNHPIADAELGRDLGFINAIEQKLDEPPNRLFQRNAAYDTQEVMNGTDNDHFLTYRAFWFYLLNRGIVRAGTANSDSHGLTDNLLGTPRNVVYTEQTRDSFDAAKFNADVKAGKIAGTNGPVIELSVEAADGSTRAPSIAAIEPAVAARVFLTVRAAPWVPVAEVRVIVNGGVVKTVVAPELKTIADDEFGAGELVRFQGALQLDELLPDDGRDAWLIVEAGAPLLVAGDLDCDAIPDTGDNNADGVIDWRDVERDEPLDEAPDSCDEDQEVGPLPKFKAPSRGEVGYHFSAVTPGGYPLGFTNPLLFDRDGGGFE